MNSVELIESGVALASELASDGNNEDSNTVAQITTAFADLTRWEWLPRGRGVSLRWLDDGQVIDRIVDEAAARHTAEQIARSRGVLGAGEVVR